MYNHQLDTFIKVADKGSFSKAADDLNISPTAVIKQMNLLGVARSGVTLSQPHAPGAYPHARGRVPPHRRHATSSSTATRRPTAPALADAAGQERHPRGVVSHDPELLSGGPSAARCEKRLPRSHHQSSSPSRTPPRTRGASSRTSAQDIDIVAGAFDDAFLKSRRVRGAPARPHARFASPCPPQHPARRPRRAHRPRPQRARRYSSPQRGWNEETDRLQDFIDGARCRGPTVEEFPFHRCLEHAPTGCEEEGKLLVTIDAWEERASPLEPQAGRLGLRPAVRRATCTEALRSNTRSVGCYSWVNRTSGSKLTLLQLGRT